MESPPTHAPQSIWISTGEASGDMHGAALVRALQTLAPDWEFLGGGGPALKAAGLRLEFSIQELSVMGLTEVLSALPRIVRLLARIRKRLKETRPSALVLIDSPDFNFLVARMAKRLGIPVFFYISPQVWAWRKGRIGFLKQHATRVLCILPFEKPFYAAHGLEVDFVGHPLLDEIPLDALATITPDRDRIGLLPGSRMKELASLLPEFIDTARLLKAQFPYLTFGVARAPSIPEETLRSYFPSDLPLTIVQPEERYEFMRRCFLLLAASGTVTMEAALIGTPTIVAYRLSPFTFALGKKLVHVDHISLPNLILGERVFPELLQEDARSDVMAEHARFWLQHDEETAEVRIKLNRLKNLMGDPGAPARAAHIIHSTLTERY